MIWGVYELDVIADDSLGRFVSRWYGLPDRPRSPLDLPAMPEPLAEWHRVAARYSLPLSRDHAMTAPADLDGSGSPGLVRFWSGTDDWYSYAPGSSDPQVIENDTVETGLPLSRFLVYAAVYEATYTPLHGLVRMSPAPDELRQVKLRLRELDDPLWRWPSPETRYHGDDDLLAHLGPDRVVIAARHRDALGRFDGLGLPWDWDTRTV
ncbi:hypothetical protein [Dactylosporangium sp. NPDC005555]|uniref:hypothetical protein n=1 Tax=Dactylosporangium sp. NPDC005555 TaxID=3154889 RepID=UPI0033BF3598